MAMRKKSSSKRRGGNDYWQSYSDMMAALLLMFILIMALTLLRSLRMFEEKNADLQRQQITIDAQRIEIEDQQKKLDAWTQRPSTVFLSALRVLRLYPWMRIWCPCSRP